MRCRHTSTRYESFLRATIQVVQTDQSLSGLPLLAVRSYALRPRGGRISSIL